MNSMSRWVRMGLIAIALIAPMACVGQAFAVVGVNIWISGDDLEDLYTGTATSTTTYVGGTVGWPVAGNFIFTTPTASYLYVVAADIGASVWGVGGYLKLNSSGFTAILPGSGWDSTLVGYSMAWPNQATVDGWITAANTASSWVPAGPGTAVAGFGLPTDYGSVTRPALGSIWDPSASGPYATVLFRRLVVPEPASVMLLALGATGLLARRRSA